MALDVPWHRFPAAARRPGFVAVAVLLVTAALGARTWFRAHDWTDGLRFYQQTIRDGGRCPPARARGSRSPTTKGATPARRSVCCAIWRLHYPRAYSARVSLATILFHLGRADEARTDLEAVAADLLAATDRRAGPREFAVTIRTLDRLEPPADPAWGHERRRAMLDRMATRFPRLLGNHPAPHRGRRNRPRSGRSPRAGHPFRR